MSLALVITQVVATAGEGGPGTTASGELATDLLPDVAGLLEVTAEVDDGEYKVVMDVLERWEANPTRGTAKRVAVAAEQAATTLSNHVPYPCYSEYHNALLMSALLYQDTFSFYDPLIPEQQEAMEQGQPAVESWYRRANEWQMQAADGRDSVFDECVGQAKDAYGRSYAFFGPPEQYLGSPAPVAPSEGWKARRYSLSTVAGALEVYGVYLDGDYAAMVDAHTAWDTQHESAAKRTAAAALGAAAQKAAATLSHHDPYPCYQEYWSALYDAALAMEGAFDYHPGLRWEKKAKKLGKPTSKETLQRAYGWHAKAREARFVTACADAALDDYLRSYQVFGEPSEMFALVESGLLGVMTPVEK